MNRGEITGEGLPVGQPLMTDDDFEPSRTSTIQTKAKPTMEFQTYMLLEDNYDINLALAATSTKTIQKKYCSVLAPHDAVEYIRLRSTEVISQWI